MLAIIGVVLLGILYSLTFAGAATSTISFTVISGTGVSINVIAIPEKRVPPTGNNGTILTVEVRSPGLTTPLLSQTITTGSGGTFSGLTLLLDPGTYDLTAKGYSHLRMLKQSVAIAANVTVDFTDSGTSPLLCGDVNATTGDNKVNGIDLTQIVGGLTTYFVRYDLNRDSAVNGIDLTDAVANLNETGAS